MKCYTFTRCPYATADILLQSSTVDGVDSNPSDFYILAVTSAQAYPSTRTSPVSRLSPSLHLNSEYPIMILLPSWVPKSRLHFRLCFFSISCEEWICRVLAEPLWSSTVTFYQWLQISCEFLDLCQSCYLHF